MQRLALGAQSPHEPLRGDEAQGRREQKRFHAEIAQPRDGRQRVVRVERREDQMAGERRANCKLGGFRVPRLADQQHVGILPQQSPEGGGKGEADLLANLRLPDGVELVFDRVLQRVNYPPMMIERVQRRMQRGRFPRARRPGEIDQSGGTVQCAVERAGLVRQEAELAERLRRHRLIEEPDHETFPMHGRERAQAQMKPLSPPRSTARPSCGNRFSVMSIPPKIFPLARNASRCASGSRV
jgi:hypothetical protein